MRHEFLIEGIIRGGKNNVLHTRSGHSYPNPEWARWRDRVVRELKGQKKANFSPFKRIVSVDLDYWPGDLRRRDVPAILDSIWHCMERAEIIVDDSLLSNVKFTNRGLDRKNPRVKMWISEQKEAL